MKVKKYLHINESQLVDIMSLIVGKNNTVPIKKLTEDIILEDDDDEEESDASADNVDKVTDEQLRIDALKLSIKISKLMNKVTPEDMLEISSKVASYLKDHKVGTDFVPDQAGDEPTKEEQPEETEEVEVEETPDEFEIDLEEEPAPESENTNEDNFVIPDEFIL